jgi:hypothetical protein
MVGRILLVKNASELSSGLSLQPYVKGLYMIRVIHGQEFVKMVKIIKE